MRLLSSPIKKYFSHFDTDRGYLSSSRALEILCGGRRAKFKWAHSAVVLGNMNVYSVNVPRKLNCPL